MLAPSHFQHGEVNQLSNLLLHEEMNNMFTFAHFPHMELDGAYLLSDGHQAMVMERLDELSVCLDSLHAMHEHFIDEHWIPI